MFYIPLPAKISITFTMVYKLKGVPNEEMSDTTGDAGRFEAGNIKITINNNHG